MEQTLQKKTDHRQVEVILANPETGLSRGQVQDRKSVV